MEYRNIHFSWEELIALQEVWRYSLEAHHAIEVFLCFADFVQ